MLAKGNWIRKEGTKKRNNENRTSTLEHFRNEIAVEMPWQEADLLCALLTPFSKKKEFILSNRYLSAILCKGIQKINNHIRKSKFSFIFK